MSLGRRRGPLGALLLSLLAPALLFAPRRGEAADPPTVRAESGAAREADRAAKALFATGDFRGALVKLEEAYALSKEPRLLYDMALCQRNLHAYARMRALLIRYARDEGGRLQPAERAAVASALEAVASLVGQVRVAATPDGARVTVDGEDSGTTPLAEPVVLDLGAHTLRVEKEGFVPAERSVNVKGGEVSELALDLTPLGSLTVTTDERATVAIDGKVVEHGRRWVTAGAHVVRVSEAGMRTAESEVDVRAGENRTLDVTLEAQKRPLWPWIVGGAALVAAGAIVGGYALAHPSTTTTPPPPGTLGGTKLTRVELR